MSDSVETTEPIIPANPSYTRRYLVEIHPNHRTNIGQFEDVGAESFEVESGCLVFRDANGNLIFARAAGTWLTCVPEAE